MIGPSLLPDITYWYRCDVLETTDGDTVVLHVDQGFTSHREQPLRALGVDAADKPRSAKDEATTWSRDWIAEHRRHVLVPGPLSQRWPFFVRYEKWDKYAPRIDGVLVCGLGHCWNDALLASGHAKEYSGGARTVRRSHVFTHPDQIRHDGEAFEIEPTK